MLQLALVAAAMAIGSAQEHPLHAPARLPFTDFAPGCERRLPAPLRRFWGARPHPALSMIAPDVLWQPDDPNLAVLPSWRGTGGGGLTAPFVDTHIAVRFLGGVGNFSDVTAPNCTDKVTGLRGPGGVDRVGRWCDLVVRQPDGSLKSRFDLVRSRLDRFHDNGIDLMIVLDDVPWAFVGVRSETCQGFGCQYLPPKDPAEFAKWVGELAAFMLKSYGQKYASRIRWRLGTEANGPRWSNHGKVFEPYLETYTLTMKRIKQVIPAAQVGASNWVEVTGSSGNLTEGGSDAFQWKFYSALAADPSIPLDWVSESHYGSAHAHPADRVQVGNFPGADYIQRTPSGTSGEFELEAMRKLAQRPSASLEIQEWSILGNEVGGKTWEPSSLGTAWTAASVATHMCSGVDRIFHWETGTTLRNSSGDGRLVNFYEQWPWNMAMLELFIGGNARVKTWLVVAQEYVPGGSGAPTIALIESVKDGEYYALVAALGRNRSTPFTTTVSWSTDAPALQSKHSSQQWIMNSSHSVTETVLRELKDKPGMLLHDDGLPYDFGRLLTPAGQKYAEAPENLERYWKLQADAFQPSPFEGSVERGKKDGEMIVKLEVTAPSVTVFAAKKAAAFV
jgi:hypothetical protein